MTTTLLLVGHGSRDADGNAEIEQFVQLWQARQPGWQIELCFIEFAEVLLDSGLDCAARLAQAGNGKLLVLPLILNAAGHVKGDIPWAVEQARLRHPQVQFDIAPHLGAGEPALAMLQRQLRQCLQRLDVPDPRSTGVILLGRGSSDRQANGEVAKLARWLWEEAQHELVDIAFTGITHPRLERVVQRQVLLGMTQIVILPYYLYTGTLVKRIQRQLQHLRQQYPQIRFALGHYLGFVPEVFALLEQRVERWQRGAPHATVRHDVSGHVPHHHHAHDHDHAHDHAHEHHDHDHHHHTHAPAHAEAAH